jgi:hypothetical protein
MKQLFSNATVAWNEQEIARRESLIREIPILLYHAWLNLNSAIKMERCETPILVPAQYLSSHISTGFEMINAGTRGYLRPETTVGTYEAFAQKNFKAGELKKYLPYCMWQVGCSFRDEKTSETMRATKLRLVQFYQMEFQLFASHGSKAPYLEVAIEELIRVYGGRAEYPTDLPHYSEKTIDWMLNDLEVAGLSIRKDWQHGMVFEVAIGLDRLVALQTQI